MECAVCGQPGAIKCLAVDEHGNPMGEWVHITCAPRSSLGAEYQSFGCISTYRVPPKAQATLRKMWHQTGRIQLSVARGMRRAPGTKRFLR